jgi:hypothetical protein
MTKRLLAILVCLMACAVRSELSAQELSNQERQQAQKDLQTVFLSKQLTAKVTFPGYKDGLDVKTDGSWDLKWVTRQIKDHGVGIEIGDKASITDFKIKGKSIEVHLNGGGAGTLGDLLLTSDDKKTLREGAGGKVPGGSRINLRFDYAITKADLSDVAKLISYLEPVVDTSQLQQLAHQQEIPAEFKDAAAHKLVVIGMNKATVFAVMGEPKNKSVDLDADPPTEKWQFEVSSIKTRVVTFRGGLVTKVNEF